MISYPILFYHILSYLSYSILFYHIYSILFYRILSYLFYSILFYPILSYSIISSFISYTIPYHQYGYMFHLLHHILFCFDYSIVSIPSISFELVSIKSWTKRRGWVVVDGVFSVDEVHVLAHWSIQDVWAWFRNVLILAKKFEPLKFLSVNC